MNFKFNTAINLMKILVIQSLKELAVFRTLETGICM